MRTENEIREKIEILRDRIKQIRKEYLNSGIDFSTYKSEQIAIYYFTGALEWVLQEDNQ